MIIFTQIKAYRNYWHFLCNGSLSLGSSVFLRWPLWAKHTLKINWSLKQEINQPTEYEESFKWLGQQAVQFLFQTKLQLFTLFTPTKVLVWLLWLDIQASFLEVLLPQYKYCPTSFSSKPQYHWIDEYFRFSLPPDTSKTVGPARTHWLNWFNLLYLFCLCSFLP